MQITTLIQLYKTCMHMDVNIDQEEDSSVSCYSLFLFPMLRFVDSVTLRTSQKHYMYLCRRKANDHYRQNAIPGYTVQLQFQATLLATIWASTTLIRT